MLVVLLIACGGPPLVAEPGELRIETEPGVYTEASFELHNEGSGVRTILAVEFVPDDAPAVWGGDGPWTLNPGDVADARVLFRPDEPGEWETTLAVAHDKGELHVPLLLISQAGTDDDGDGWSVAGGDCDDADPTAFPGGLDLCDGVDNDCDGTPDQGYDRDGDGHLSVIECEGFGDDCDDDDASTHPGHEEDCDLADSDCNGVIDDTRAPADLQEGVCAGATKECASGATVEPDYFEMQGYEAIEVSCDGFDNDCDGDADGFDHSGDGTLDCVDDDGDGDAEVEGDCDDADPLVRARDCGASHLVVTSTTDGFSTVTLDLRGAARHLGGRELYDAAVADASRMWLTDRLANVLTASPSSDDYDVHTRNFSPTWGIARHEGLGQVWLGRDDGVIEALDDTSLAVEVSVKAGGAATGVTVDGDVVWACALDGYLYRIDALSGAADRVFVTDECYGAPIVDVARDRVLVLGYIELDVAVVDRTTLDVLDHVALADRAIRGQLAADGLWLAGGVDGVVTRLDPETFAVQATFAIGEQVQDVWRDEARDELWATLWADDEIVRVDPSDGAVLDRIAANAPLLMEPVPP